MVPKGSRRAFLMPIDVKPLHRHMTVIPPVTSDKNIYIYISERFKKDIKDIMKDLI